ncbi:hypothetical protein [Kutzneria kofuensis]|uniref:Uncharacterized protein n=1 Tax=Kutzneria kofuensis TaxID=103725 RepID=A0A7W9KDI1_9PSEU|nr:hypothetical protein [Kutzneria kofuensis]MBB5890610.1 hypothetical protein [Kutzneria kofuensis]
MPRPSLHTRIAQLRRAYTGESDSALLPAARAAVEATLPRREEVLHILDSDFGSRLLGASGPVAHPEIRAAVLPDATAEYQREVETAVLLALGRVHAYHCPDSGTGQRAGCAMVRPALDQLALSLSPQALAAMLVELLPREAGGPLAGVARVRLRLLRRHVELYLADAGPEVAVSVSNTSYRQCAAALAFVTAITGHSVQPHEEPRPLSEREQHAITLGRTPVPVALASAVLRRFGLFRRADWVGIEPVGATCLRIDWAGGHAPAYVAAMLAHPIAGLPCDRFSASTSPDGTIILICAGLGGVVSLRQHAVPPAHPSTSAAWTAFHEVLNAPNPTHPTNATNPADQSGSPAPSSGVPGPSQTTGAGRDTDD